MLTVPPQPSATAAVISRTPSDLARMMGIEENHYTYITDFVMRIVEWTLGVFGLEHNTTVATVVYASVVFFIALGIGYVVKWIVLGAARKVAEHINGGFYKSLIANHVLSKTCRVIPALVFLGMIKVTLHWRTGLASALTSLTLIYVVVAVTIAMSTLVMAIWDHVNAIENKRQLPLKGLAQLIKGLLWIIATVVICSIIIDKSPASLLAGLGAFAAVLMLIFKDSILGVVAGVQLSEDDSLHVGDWIKVNGTDANGLVTEVNLTSVKVTNWDKTTTTLPPYSLVSGSFTNYRTMQRSNTRRICRSFMIDADSVLPCTPEMLRNVSRLPFMDKWISAKLAQRAAGHEADVLNPEGLADGTIDTNLGLFRAYMKMWLDASQYISHDDDCFVSTLQQTATGIPLQIYCFTATSKWFPYEGIQDLVFEHLAAMLHCFQLYAFESASGRDTITSGLLGSPTANIDNIYGIPYPYFQSPDAPDSPASTRVTKSAAPAAQK